jgi:hypothetical protein
MKTVKRESTRKGSVITDNYSKNVVKKNVLGQTVNKNVSTRVVTDLANKKTSAYGIKTKKVVDSKDKDIVLRSKTKVLSPRKVIRGGY